MGEVGIVDGLRGIGCGQLGEDHRHDGVFPEAVDLLRGGIRKQGGAVLLGFGDGAGERSGGVNGVGVGEQEPAPFRNLCSAGHGVVFAGPVFREWAGGDYFHIGKRRAISAVRSVGVVVDDDDFEANCRLGGQGFQAGGDVGFFVAGGDDDGDDRITFSS